MRFSLMFSLVLAIALVLAGSASALELSRTLPAADITQTPYEVRFLIFDGPEAIQPIEIAGEGLHRLRETQGLAHWSARLRDCFRHLSG